jgi:PE-PPE domain
MICAFLGAGIVAVITTPIAHADTAIVLPGATRPGVHLWDEADNPRIGANYYSLGFDIQVIGYPRNPLRADQSINDGVNELDAAIRGIDEPIVVVGFSMGGIVASREQAALADDPDAPPPDQMTFIIIASPEVGIARYLPEGMRILGYTIGRHAPERQYDTIVVIGENDGWADPPDRPRNLVADINAIMGAYYMHTNTALSDPAEVPPENVTVTTNSRGATTTTYLVPTEQLPLTQPLRDVVVPDPVVDRMDSVLRPIVDAGYSRNDPAPVDEAESVGAPKAPKLKPERQRTVELKKPLLSAVFRITNPAPTRPSTGRCVSRFETG